MGSGEARMDLCMYLRTDVRGEHSERERETFIDRAMSCHILATSTLENESKRNRGIERERDGMSRTAMDGWMDAFATHNDRSAHSPISLSHLCRCGDVPCRLALLRSRSRSRPCALSGRGIVGTLVPPVAIGAAVAVGRSRISNTHRRQW